MHFFYTLLASGLLILSEVPVDLFLPQLSNPNRAEQPVATIERDSLYKPNLVVAVEPLKDHPEEQAAESAPGVTPTSTPIAQSTPAPSNANTSTNRQHSSLPIRGYAMYYNPNVMQEVLDNRLRMGHVSACPECVGQVALLRAGDLNRRVWLQWSDGVVEGPFLVADVAATQHVAQLLARNWVVDVDYRTAIRRRMAGPVPVTVWGSPPTGDVQPAAPTAPPFVDTAITVHSEVQPVQTPAPTFTPFALNATVPNTNVAQQAGFPTATPIPTVTPLPAIVGVPVVANVQQAAFPPDTPVPTITPLPALNAAPAMPVMTMVATSGPSTVPVPTYTPTMTPSPLPQDGLPQDGQAQPPAAFPPDTPVPTITPLPAIN